jgi:hypothetical protein
VSCTHVHADVYIRAASAMACQDIGNSRGYMELKQYLQGIQSWHVVTRSVKVMNVDVIGVIRKAH